MPIYEYQCQRCGQIREELQKFSDAPLTTCSHCGGELTKLISQSSFHLKGGGWYVSEYGRGNSGPANPAPASETVTESTPAAKKTETPAPSKPANTETAS